MSLSITVGQYHSICPMCPSCTSYRAAHLSVLPVRYLYLWHCQRILSLVCLCSASYFVKVTSTSFWLNQDKQVLFKFSNLAPFYEQFIWIAWDHAFSFWVFLRFLNEVWFNYYYFLFLLHSENKCDQSSHLTIGKKAKMWISQNVKPLL